MNNLSQQPLQSTISEIQQGSEYNDEVKKMYNAWIEERNERIKLQQNVAILQQQIAELQATNQKINVRDKALIEGMEQELQIQDTDAGFSTDEEELTKETEWITKGRRKGKKRKMNSSPETSPPQKQDTKQEQKKINPAKIPKPPPVVLSQIKNYDTLQTELNKNKFTFQATMMNNEQVKINVENAEQYKSLTRFLNENKYFWHSYENKQTRDIKVMARRLHPSCVPVNIVNDLHLQGYKILEAVNILNSKEKKPLPLFMLTFANDEDIKKIYEIKTVLGMKVDIEPMRKSKLVSQCKKCQTFGHTQKFCNREARCVKCAGKHHTKECKIEEKTKPKCANCGDAHPASYRGCEVAKRLQKIRNEATKKNQSKTKENKQENKPHFRLDPKSFPALPPKPVPEAEKEDSHKEEMTTNQILQKLMSKIEKQEEKYELQEKMLKVISERLLKLEKKSNKDAATPMKKK